MVTTIRKYKKVLNKELGSMKQDLRRRRGNLTVQKELFYWRARICAETVGRDVTLGRVELFQG